MCRYCIVSRLVMYICDSYNFLVKSFCHSIQLILVKIWNYLGNSILCTDQSTIDALCLMTSAAHLMLINTAHQMHLLHIEKQTSCTFCVTFLTNTAWSIKISQYHHLLTQKQDNYSFLWIQLCQGIEHTLKVGSNPPATGSSVMNRWPSFA